MEWSELPQEYRDLEIPEHAKDSNDYDLDSEKLADRFSWEMTNEGFKFWQLCYYAKTIQDLPPIPKPKMTEQFREAGEKAGEKRMNITTAIEIVENFNKWRVGESEHIAKPSQITEAIDLVLGLTKKAITNALKEMNDSNKIDLNKNRFQ